MRRIGLLAAALIIVITWMFYRNDAIEENEVSSSPPVTVEVVRLSKGVLNQQVHLLGNVFALRSVEVKPEVEGRISDIAVQSGQRVKQGQLLVQLDNRHQRAVVMREKARLSDIQRQHQNLLQLLPKGATTQAEVDRYESQVAMQQAELAIAEAALQDRALRAPFDGQLGLVDLSLGQVVDSASVLMTLDDASTLRLNVPVPARYLGQIQLGQTAQLRQSGAEQRLFKAQVTSIDSRVRGETLNVFVQLSIDNQQGVLAPGTLVSGELSLPSTERLLMPMQAIAYNGERRYAYRLNQQSVNKVEVTLGQRDDERVEVLSGLAAGDQVVYKGLVKLHDGIEVEVLN